MSLCGNDGDAESARRGQGEREGIGELLSSSSEGLFRDNISFSEVVLDWGGGTGGEKFMRSTSCVGDREVIFFLLREKDEGEGKCDTVWPLLLEDGFFSEEEGTDLIPPNRAAAILSLSVSSLGAAGSTAFSILLLVRGTVWYWAVDGRDKSFIWAILLSLLFFLSKPELELPLGGGVTGSTFRLLAPHTWVTPLVFKSKFLVPKDSESNPPPPFSADIEDSIGLAVIEGDPLMILLLCEALDSVSILVG
jgi:hypothetical protein